MKIIQGKFEDRARIYELISALAKEHVFQTFEQEGPKYFLSSLQANIDEIMINPEKMYLLLVNKELIGAAGFGLNGHINHFFIRTIDQRRGLGRLLFDAVKKNIKSKVIDVNSSLNAIGFYEKLGFNAFDSIKTVNGITFQPMHFSAA